jgi:hypothetical protein
MLGCSKKPEARLAVYGLADRYVTLRGEGASTLLALGEDGSFLLSGVVRPAYGKISPGAELARGTWVPTARGLTLQSEEWEAVLVADTSQVFARDRAETIANLVWVRSTSPSPVDSMTLVSWPELSELLYPRGGSGKRHGTW